MAWDRLGDKARQRLQDQLVREQVRAVASGSAYWKKRFADIGRPAASVTSVDKLASVPAVGERDVSPTGDAAAMASLVLHGGEKHFALHTHGPTLRRALRKKATRSRDYPRIVARETRATSYGWTGLGFRYPVASTRGDLDVLSRTGARMWSVIGATADDALLAAVPPGSVEYDALHYAALGAGAPALFPGIDPAEVATAALLAPPTVLAVAAAAATQVLTGLNEAGVPLKQLRTLLLVGAPTDDERAAARRGLADVGAAGDAVVLGVHVPAGGRLAWAECRPSAGGSGLHTYPDHDLVQVVDPESGDPVSGEPSTAAGAGGELVLSQLGLRGSAVLRWRTGDLAAAIDTSPCPACQRKVPRLVGVRRGALVVATDAGLPLDLRAVAGALAGRADLADWRVVVGGRARDGRQQVVVHLAPNGDAGAATVGAAADIRAAAGMLPSQLVLAENGELGRLPGEALTRRMLLRR
ncbi:MAG: phenylacetate-CoA ligase [Frankiaceae bacterium]|nr:phenylacetate-CoA ligase [Frankiaceae bacterium]